jgi:hypothetical protein
LADKIIGKAIMPKPSDRRALRGVFDKKSTPNPNHIYDVYDCNGGEQRDSLKI